MNYTEASNLPANDHATMSDATPSQLAAIINGEIDDATPEQIEAAQVIALHDFVEDWETLDDWLSIHK